MEEKFEPQEGHYLELLDRVHVMGCMFNDHVVEHPLVYHLEKTNEFHKFHVMLERIQTDLADLYQMTGNLADEHLENKKS